MTDDTLISTTIDGPIATVTMNRPHRLNALSRDLVEQLIEALEHARERQVRAVILRAQAGVRTWSAGHDIEELALDGTDPLMWSTPLEDLLRSIRALPMPVIAAVEGGVWGAACDMAFTCDLVVATDTATFAITPAKIGVPYNLAGIQHFLGVLPLHVIKEMFFTADPLPAVEAAQYGLVNRLASDADDLTVQAEQVAHRIAQMAPLVISAVKAELTALTEADPMTPETFERLASLRRGALRSADYAEGLRAFHERRTPQFRGE